MQDLISLNIDYCQFSDWGYTKPTRIWGSPYLVYMEPKLCDRVSCSNLVRRGNGKLGHRHILGATPRDGLQHPTCTEQYRIPEKAIEYLMGLTDKEINGIASQTIPVSPDNSTSQLARGGSSSESSQGKSQVHKTKQSRAMAYGETAECKT